MSKVWIGIDNGVSGTITILSNNKIFHFSTPVKKELSYTKTKQYINRVDVVLLEKLIVKYVRRKNSFCIIERPMINPMRFKSSMSAMRSLEATLIVLEKLKIGKQYIDSKEWQKAFIPEGILKLKSKKKSMELKNAAVDIAKRLFPSIKTKDADSILIAEYAKRMNY